MESFDDHKALIFMKSNIPIFYFMVNNCVSCLIKRHPKIMKIFFFKKLYCFIIHIRPIIHLALILYMVWNSTKSSFIPYGYSCGLTQGVKTSVHSSCNFYQVFTSGHVRLLTLICFQIVLATLNPLCFCIHFRKTLSVWGKKWTWSLLVFNWYCIEYINQFQENLYLLNFEFYNP